MRDLAELLDPVGVDEFFSTHWERAPLHVRRRRPDAHHSLLTIDDLEAVIAATPRDAPHESVGGAVATAVTVDGVTTRGSLPLDIAGQVSPTAVYAALAAGESVVVRHLRRSWPPIAALCEGVETVLRQPISANLFLTPPGAAAFPAHHDTSDTFFVQVEGTKVWELHEPRTPLPWGPVPESDRDAHGEATTIVLDPGDVLFLPRGWVHRGVAGSEASLHVTVGTTPIRWVEVLEALLRRAASHDMDLRRSVPLHDTAALTASSVVGHLRTLLDRIPAESGPDALTDVVAGVLGGLPQPLIGRIRDIVTPVDIDDDTVLEIVGGLGPVVRPDGQHVRLHVAGGHVRGPGEALEVFEWVARHRSFRVGEMPIDGAGRIELARVLLVEGVVTVRH